MTSTTITDPCLPTSVLTSDAFKTTFMNFAELHRQDINAPRRNLKALRQKFREQHPQYTDISYQQFQKQIDYVIHRWCDCKLRSAVKKEETNEWFKELFNKHGTDWHRRSVRTEWEEYNSAHPNSQLCYSTYYGRRRLALTKMQS